MPSAAVELQKELAEQMAEMTLSPALFAKTAYPWGEGVLEKATGPRVWQGKILDLLESKLQNRDTCYQPIRIAISSGHGIGKSSLIGMIMGWAMSTCEDCKIVVTANTGTQLATKTVPRVEEWFRLMITAPWWDLKATSITVNDPGHERLWRADYIPWSENNTEAFAGLHNKGKRIVLVFDEASGIADKIWETAEGALTDEETEIIWLAFGNPTQNTGRFRECFGKFKHRWETFQIDSRNVEGTNKAEIDKWIADYGEDSDFVRVRVRGEFPRAGSNQFIGSDLVAACRKYRAVGYQALPKVLSVDVARFGDDQTVVGTRQGRYSAILGKYRGLDTVQVAERVIEFMQKEAPDAIVIDGDGLGAGVVDHIKFRGFGARVFEFHGGSAALDPVAYYNRRAQCWGMLRDWLAAGAQIADDPELEADLTGPEYGFSARQQIQLERKEDMKKRGLASPDCGDMLAMTFAVKVLPQPKRTAPVRVGTWG
jgi:hypothetical protein